MNLEKDLFIFLLAVKLNQNIVFVNCILSYKGFSLGLKMENINIFISIYLLLVFFWNLSMIQVIELSIHKEKKILS